MSYTLGLDIGGTKISGVLFNGQDCLAGQTIATPQDNLGNFLAALEEMVLSLKNKSQIRNQKIKGLGIGIPGIMDSQQYKILKCNNLPFLNGVKLKSILEKKFQLPIFIDNDTNNFLRAEVKLGIAKKFSNVLGIIIGTGIGGAWWINNDIYKGAHGGSGEPGRMIINFSEPLELEAAYHQLTQNNPKQLAREALAGDILAKKSFEEFGQDLGLALANIVNLLDPEVIIIGGGTIEASAWFLPATKEAMLKYIMSSEASKKIKIHKGQLGALAGSIGAALLVK